jgi:hypothetical protein
MIISYYTKRERERERERTHKLNFCLSYYISNYVSKLFHNFITLFTYCSYILYYKNNQTICITHSFHQKHNKDYTKKGELIR